MNRQDTTQDLLNVDLDAVVAKGRAKKKKTMVAVVIAVAVCVAVVLVARTIYNRNKQLFYEEAMTAMDAKDYSAAAELFEQAGRYKDSRNKMEDAEFAVEFMESDLCSIMQETFITAFEQSGTESGFQNVACNYDPYNRFMVVSFNLIDSSIEDIDNLTPMVPLVFGLWAVACNNMDELSAATQSAVEEAGYKVGCLIDVYDESENLLYESSNGEPSFCCIDMEAVEGSMYSQLYSQVVSYVENGQYQEAYEYFSTNNIAEYYTTDYQDLSDYINYAKGVSLYVEGKEIPISDIYDAFELVSENFKDRERYIKDISTIMQSLNGIYALEKNNSNSKRVGINMNGNFGDVFLYEKYNSFFISEERLLVDFSPLTVYADVESAVVKEGVLKKVIAKVTKGDYDAVEKHLDIVITPTNNGIFVEFDGEYWQSKTTFAKVADIE